MANSTENNKEYASLFVKHDIAKFMRDNGFDKSCIDAFSDDGILLNQKLFTKNSSWKGTKCIAAPLWQQAKDWFREEQGMNIDAYQADSGNYVYCVDSTGANNHRIAQDGNWPYYEALEKGMRRAIKIIKNKKGK